MTGLGILLSATLVMVFVKPRWIGQIAAEIVDGYRKRGWELSRPEKKDEKQ